MKITVLGCGSSGGVPLIGNDWGACDPADPRNRRRRVSVLVEEGDVTLLVDTSPDAREQLLDCGLKSLSAVLYTHAHADHCHGIDDLRSVNWLLQRPVPVYADAATVETLRTRFSYIFAASSMPEGFHRPRLEPHVIEGPLQFGPVRVVPFRQGHGPVHSSGFRFNDFAYSTDVKSLDEAAFEALRGVKVWIVDCIREPEHPTHSHLAQTLAWIARVNPERAFLTHMDQSLDYAALAAKLPAGVAPAHDGLVIAC
jgi:phosphoribosyl 1,2-cyclic phosphate phosphodiesterase